MIRIRHNGAERSADPAGLASLEDLVARSCQETGRDGEVLVRCRVNGMALDDERLSELAQVPLEQVASVDLETRPPAAIARDGLAHSREYAGRVGEALSTTAELFREGRVEEANHLYADVLDALSVLVYAVDAAGRQLGDAGSPLDGLQRELRPWLDELLDAQSGRDWVRVADYLEYEMAPLVADWSRRIDGVLGAVESPRA
jgi:hypothetical protein